VGLTCEKMVGGVEKYGRRSRKENEAIGGRKQENSQAEYLTRVARKKVEERGGKDLGQKIGKICKSQ